MRRAIFAGITLVLVAGFVLLLAEASLRVAERFAADDVLDYEATWREGGLGRGGYLKESFSGQVIDGLGGTVRWTNNAQGFRYDRDVADRPQPGRMRILSMGDSFTAGYRVDQHQTFSHLFEERINDEVGPSEILVSCVEDPAAGLYWLERHGQGFHPGLVLLGITLGNDLAQTHVALDPHGPFRLGASEDEPTIERRDSGVTFGFRHGLETLVVPDEHRESKSLLQRAAVKLEHLRVVGLVHASAWPIASWYGDPRRPNPFDPTHGLGFYLESPPVEIEEAFERLRRLVLAYREFCLEHKIELVVLLFPQRFQIQERDWKQTLVKYGLKESSFDLLAPNRRIGELCRANSIVCIDPTETMRRVHDETGESLYLPRGDMHWTREGHRLFYEATADELLRVVRHLDRLESG